MSIRRLLPLWRWLNLPCREYARLSSEALDRPLTRSERWALRIHLISCLACRRYARQIAFLRAALAHLSTHVDHDDLLPGPELPAEARQRIRHLLEQR
jgi:predicted anti-sigma-YlaC factor YlaD